VITTLDGGFALVGSRSNYGGHRGIWLIKTNSSGDTSWTQKYGGPYGEAPSCIIQTSDSGFLIGGFILSGYTSSYGALTRDAWIIKTDEFGNITSILSDEPDVPRRSRLYQNYPNPFNPTTTINYELRITDYVELYIFNVLGQRVALLVLEKQASGQYTVIWDASDFSNGIYFYRLTVGNDYSELKKMLLLK
jgi:hypothetical protein